MIRETQEQFVLKLVDDSGRKGIRTFMVNRYGLDNFITSADRKLRILQRKGLIIGKKISDDKVKTWWTIENYILFNEQGGVQ